MNKSIISIPTKTEFPSGVVLTFENTSSLLTILVSVSILAGIAIKLISNQNRISTAIEQIQLTLKEYSQNTQKIRELERLIDLHIKDYTNQNKIIEILLEKISQKLDDKSKRLGNDVKEMQRFLQRDLHFTVREREIGDDDE